MKGKESAGKLGIFWDRKGTSSDYKERFFGKNCEEGVFATSAVI